MTTSTITHYDVIDSATGRLMGSYNDRRWAVRRADKLDSAYGAVRYVVRPIFAPVPVDTSDVIISAE